MNSETEKVINDLRDHFGIDVDNLVKRGLLPVMAAKRWLVRELYFVYARQGHTTDKNGRTYTDIKNELSAEYGISVSSIEKIIYRGLN
ncbi:MAG: hypothetical protein EOM90_16740 [Alphaproteobacteria bacterium]|nr:hypothetical protein [Alphaproteobacteria bacterium]